MSLTSGAFAQGVSAGCTAVNALGSQSLVLGTPVTFGPFSGFDEGFANQPSDGDTIRLGIGARDMNVTVEYIGSGGTTNDTMTPASTFSNLIIGSSANHPENGSLSIRLTMTGGTSTRPSVFIQCLGTPNPGQPAGSSSSSSTQQQILSGAFAVVQAEDSAKLGNSPTDLPSKLISTADAALSDPQQVLEDLAAEMLRGIGPLRASAKEEFEKIMRLDLRAEGIPEERIDEIVKEVGFGEVNEYRLWFQDFLRTQGFSERKIDVVMEKVDPRADEESLRELLESEIFSPDQIDIVIKAYVNGDPELIGEGRRFTSQEMVAAGEAIDHAGSVLEERGSGNLGLAAVILNDVDQATSPQDLHERISRAIELLDGIVPEGRLSAWRGVLDQAGSNFDIGLSEGETVLRADTNSILFGFSMDGSDAGVDIGPNTSLWLQGRVSFMMGNAQGTSGSAFNLRAGIIHGINPKADVGGYFGAFRSDQTIRSSGEKNVSEAYQLGAYGNLRIARTLTLGTNVFFEGGATSTNNAGVTGRYGYRVLGASLSLSGQKKWRDWILTPSVSIAHSRRTTDAYVNSAAVTVPSTATTSNSLTASITAGRSKLVDHRRVRRIDTRISAGATYYDRRHSVLSALNQKAAGASVGYGITLHMRSGATITLDSNISGLGQDTPTLGLSGRYRIQF